MAAPELIFTVSGKKISAVSGYDQITVTFSSDVPYTEFQCRATKDGEAWGVGVGDLIASFSFTPANTERTFDIYDDHLLKGEGAYRISLLAKGEDGEWNDKYPVSIQYLGTFNSGGSSLTTTTKTWQGRNWKELDAMSTTWKNWQAATWWLLLFGNLAEEAEVV